ncbi:MAG: type III polyketide synthase [Schleiferiaceae bacterium]|jgi:predicted naringenin-chalcone synthase|nr:type III polyketide synthase [Schleiferiaceae bacterium]MDR9441532.1 type III polyketide synthase [Schleiferiaceae bacterium]
MPQEHPATEIPAPKILSAVRALPAYHRKTEDILPYVEQWLSDQPERFRKKVLRLYRNAQVDDRYSIMPPEEVFRETSFEEKNRRYAQAMTDLGEQALQRALTAARLQPEQLDYIITVSCTGIMIPSVDAYLINRLVLREDIIRLPVTEMGCAGGTAGLIYAQRLLRAHPGARAAVLALESPTSTLQHQDFSMTNMVSTAIFGDGAACAILGPDPGRLRPAIMGEGMYHFFDEPDMMGFQLRNTGLQMVLDVAVPDKIDSQIDDILIPFLQQQGSSLEEIDHFLFHPGGRKIVQTVEERLQPLGKDIDLTKQVLRQFGNMSSATILYVLAECMEQQRAREGDQGLMLSFGPGFSAQRLFLKWQF